METGTLRRNQQLAKAFRSKQKHGAVKHKRGKSRKAVQTRAAGRVGQFVGQRNHGQNKQ